MDLRRFEGRKADHLRLAVHPQNDASQNSLDRVKLIPDALPELDFSQVSLKSQFWSYAAVSPFFISSMTAGHHEGEDLNLRLAKVAGDRGWPMGVGSQRRELSDPLAKDEWQRLRKAAPETALFSNLGLSQIIRTPVSAVVEMAKNLSALAIIIHLNPLQECLQPEGTPQFAGGLKALEALKKNSPFPLIVKETGCGMGKATIQKLMSLGIDAIDVAGFGGTHWGRIEGARAAEQNYDSLASAAHVFADWGIPTLDSLLAADELVSSLEKPQSQVWASGGIRTGLDAAKCVALGAHKVGFAKPALEAALESEEALFRWMEQRELELKIALFNTGSETPDALREGKKWQKI